MPLVKSNGGDRKTLMCRFPLACTSSHASRGAPRSASVRRGRHVNTRPCAPPPPLSHSPQIDVAAPASARHVNAQRRSDKCKSSYTRTHLANIHGEFDRVRSAAALSPVCARTPQRPQLGVQFIKSECASLGLRRFITNSKHALRRSAG